MKTISPPPTHTHTAFLSPVPIYNPGWREALVLVIASAGTDELISRIYSDLTLKVSRELRVPLLPCPLPLIRRVFLEF